MIRGINKRIIEVNDTGSELFEKALLFVRSDSRSDDVGLKKEAEKIVAAYVTPDDANAYKPGYLRYTESKRKFKAIAFFVLSVFIAAAAVTGLYLYFK